MPRELTPGDWYFVPMIGRDAPGIIQATGEPGDPEGVTIAHVELPATAADGQLMAAAKGYHDATEALKQTIEEVEAQMVSMGLGELVSAGSEVTAIVPADLLRALFAVHAQATEDPDHAT